MIGMRPPSILKVNRRRLLWVGLALLLSTMIRLDHSAPSAVGAAGGGLFGGESAGRGREAVLATGKAGEVKWTIMAVHEARRSAQEPCIRAFLTLGRSEGVIGGETSCGDVLQHPRGPLVSGATSLQTTTRVLGVAFARDVKILKVEMNNGSRRFVRSRVWKQRDGDFVGLKPFSFAVIVFRHDLCYRRIVGLSRSRKALFELVGGNCP
jgi:hypothetical protein